MTDQDQNQNQNQDQNQNQNQTTAATQEAPGLANLEAPLSSSPSSDRRMSAEWDASKVPPSRFQKRKGSIYAVPASRDGHVQRNYQSSYHEKLTEKGWGK